MLGFTKTQPIALHHDGTPHQKGWLDDQALSVVAADPRFLIIKVQSSFLRCLVVAAHAHTVGLSRISLRLFGALWLLPYSIGLMTGRNCCSQMPIAEFGDCPNQHIGDHEAEASTPKSEAFCHFVVSQNLFIPASFASFHSGPSGTWRHPNGNGPGMM